MGHQHNALHHIEQVDLIPKMLDKSRFNPRLYQVEDILVALFFQVGLHFKKMNVASDYMLASFPVAVCDNIRISNCKMLRGENWRGFTATMRRYFIV